MAMKILSLASMLFFAFVSISFADNYYTSGDITYYNSDDGCTGTAINNDDITYYNFSDGTTGTTMHNGDFSYHHFSNGNDDINGTSIDLGGGITTHDFDDGTTGTTIDLGGGIRTYNLSNGQSGTIIDMN